MAESITTSRYRIGMSGDPANNFDLEPDGAGSLLVKRASTGATVLQIDAAGNMLGNVPAFSVRRAAGGLTNGPVYTLYSLTDKDFDTSNAFDNLTNFRFNPKIAGYYFITATVGLTHSVRSDVIATLFLNGAEYAWTQGEVTTAALRNSVVVSGVIFMNGTTDYVDLRLYSSVSVTVLGGQRTTMSGFLVGAA